MLSQTLQNIMPAKRNSEYKNGQIKTPLQGIS